VVRITGIAFSWIGAIRALGLVVRKPKILWSPGPPGEEGAFLIDLLDHVICLVSALQFHEITLQLPRSVWIAIGSKDRKPTIDYPPIRIARFGEKARTIGVKTYTIDSVPVRIFDPAKSIVDCSRFRNAVGLDVAMEALRMGWRSRKAKPDDIARYAQALRIWSVVRPYLESAVADEG
jgi:predicted transcriptional regulator of viral defense system